MTTTPWWINLIVIAVGLIIQILTYRTGCKHGYARGHEDGRKHGGTEVANMINGMRAKPTTGDCPVEGSKQCEYTEFSPTGERAPHCIYCGRPEPSEDDEKSSDVEPL